MVWTESITSERRGLHDIDLLENVFKRGLGHQKESATREAESVPAKLDLSLGLFTGDVEDGAPGPGQQLRDLEEQRALADARFAPDQHQRPWNDTAAKDTVKLADSGWKTRRIPSVHHLVGLRFRKRLRQYALLLRRLAALNLLTFLDKRIPVPAFGTSPEPF